VGTVPARLKFLFDAVESLRIRTALRPASLASGDGSRRHSPNSSRGDVTSGV
jgi:hypothetical protein